MTRGPGHCGLGGGGTIALVALVPPPREGMQQETCPGMQGPP